MPDAPKTYAQLKREKGPNTKPLYDLRRGTVAQRGYGARWQRLSKAVLARDVICQHNGCELPATEADHIIPKPKGGQDTMDNLQGLCKPCHSRKTASEDGGFGR